MPEPRDFNKRVGSVFIPVAEDVAISEESASVERVPTAASSQLAPIPVPIHVCKTTLREG